MTKVSHIYFETTQHTHVRERMVPRGHNRRHTSADFTVGIRSFVTACDSESHLLHTD